MSFPSYSFLSVVSELTPFFFQIISLQLTIKYRSHTRKLETNFYKGKQYPEHTQPQLKTQELGLSAQQHLAVTPVTHLVLGMSWLESHVGMPRIPQEYTWEFSTLNAEKNAVFPTWALKQNGLASLNCRSHFGAFSSQSICWNRQKFHEMWE